ncbi:MAG: hypothetical protein ACI9WU_004934 [Myxococcota bacterium]|jgi:hypothetical protein
MTRTVPVVAATFLLLTAGCKKDKPEEDMSALVQSDPAAAVIKLQAKYSADASDYATIRHLADAHTRTTPPNWERAAAYFRAAMGHPDGEGKEEKRGLQGAVLTCIEHQIASGVETKMDQKKLIALYEEANELERTLGKQDIKAGKILFERARGNFDQLVKAEQYDNALAFMAGLDKIYVDEASTRTVTDQKPRILTLKFDKETLTAFAQTASDAAEAGIYDPTQKAFALSSGGTVSLGVEGALDHTLDTFPQKVEETVCPKTSSIGLIKVVLNPFALASPLQRELTDAELATFYELSRKKRRTRWEGEAWDKAKVYEPAATLKFVCTDILTLEQITTRFREIAKPGQAK